MRTKIIDEVGSEYPISAFSHCSVVIAAATKARGFGMFGCSRYTLGNLEAELVWLEEIGGQGYGLDSLLPKAFDQDSGGFVSLPSQYQTYQVVGRMNSVARARKVVEEYIDTFERTEDVNGD